MRKPFRASVSFALALPLGASLAAAAAAGPLDRAPLGAARSTFAAPTTPVGFSLHLPLRNESALRGLLRNQTSAASPMRRHWLTPSQFRASFGANESTVRTVTEQLRAQGFTVDRVGSQDVHATGTAAAFGRAFGTPVRIARSGLRARLVTQSAVQLSPSLAKTGATFVGLTPAIRHFAQIQLVGPNRSPLNRQSPYGAYWFDDLKQAYAFPSVRSLDGRGRTIGILMASTYLPSDVAAYFAHEKIKPPKMQLRTIDGGAPFDPTSQNSLEAELDVQQAGGMAPGATLVDYSIPDLSDQSLFDGVSAMVTDNTVDIASLSIGGCELFYTADYNAGVDQTAVLRSLDQLFEQGAAQGITFVAASGDNGALGCPDPTFTHYVKGVSSPADDPNVVAVGGTNLETSYAPTAPGTAPNLNATYVSENAYADPLQALDYYGIGQPLSGGVYGSGGGVSVVFPKPFYQNFVQTGSPMRTVPDVAMHMGGCPVSAVQPCRGTDSADATIFAGQVRSVIGTSLAAPDLAGLLALQEQALGGVRAGNANYEIYLAAAAQQAASAAGAGRFAAANRLASASARRPGGTAQALIFRSAIPGNNGYAATPGYNYVVGNGTVYGAAAVGMPDGPFAGTPQTPSNP